MSLTVSVLDQQKWAALLSASKRQRRRFWKHVTVQNGCWLYNSENGNRYGKWYLAHREYAAHRVAKTWAEGDPMLTAICCHKCRNKNCVRPSHIVWGTWQTNTQDRFRDGTYVRPDRGALSPSAKLSEDTVLQMCRDYVYEAKTVREIAQQYDQKFSTVASIVCGINWHDTTTHILKDKPARRALLARRLNARKRTTLNEPLVKQIKALLAAKSHTHQQIADELGVKKASVTQINMGRAWAWVAG